MLSTYTKQLAKSLARKKQTKCWRNDVSTFKKKTKQLTLGQSRHALWALIGHHFVFVEDYNRVVHVGGIGRLVRNILLSVRGDWFFRLLYRFFFDCVDVILWGEIAMSSLHVHQGRSFTGKKHLEMSRKKLNVYQSLLRMTDINDLKKLQFSFSFVFRQFFEYVVDTHKLCLT